MVLAATEMQHAAFPDPTYRKRIVWGSTITSAQELCYVIELFSIWYAIWDTLRLSVIAGLPLLTEQARVRPELTLQKAELAQYWERTFGNPTLPRSVMYRSQFSMYSHACLGKALWFLFENVSFFSTAV